MAVRYTNNLVRKVIFDPAGKPYLIRDALSAGWFLVCPWGKHDDTRLMSTHELRGFTGFVSEIVYMNRQVKP